MSVPCDFLRKVTYRRKEEKNKLTGNVGRSMAFALLLFGRGLVLTTKDLGVNLRVGDRGSVYVHVATALRGLLLTDGSSQTGKQDSKDIQVLANSRGTTLLALHVLDDLLETVRRDVDGQAPGKAQQELDKNSPRKLMSNLRRKLPFLVRLFGDIRTS